MKKLLRKTMLCYGSASLPNDLKSSVSGTGTAYTGTGYTGTAYTGTGYTGTAYTGTAYTGTAYTGTAYTGTGYTGTAYILLFVYAYCSRVVIMLKPSPLLYAELITGQDTPM